MTSAPKRRWLRFSLRTLFVVVTILCFVLGWLGWNLYEVRARRALLISYVKRGAGFNLDRRQEWEPTLIRRILGDWGAGFDIELPSTRFTRADHERLQALFPEVRVVLVDRAPMSAPSKQEIDYAEAHF